LVLRQLLAQAQLQGAKEMTREDIIRMALEAGIEHLENVEEMRSPMSDGVWLEDLEHFAALVAAAEREAIYDIVMMAPWKECGHDQDEFDSEVGTAMKAMAFSITANIRARGQA
jgi:hypothetical protein